MDKATFDDYLKNRYEDQMKYYSKKSAENRDKYRKYQWALIILSALTPVMAALDGVNLGSEEFPTVLNIKLIVVAISAIVAILTTGLKTFNYFELWVTYRKTNEELKREIYYYNFLVGPYGEPGVNRETLFVMQVEGILDKERGMWAPARKLQDDMNKPAGSGQENAIGLIPAVGGMAAGGKETEIMHEESSDTAEMKESNEEDDDTETLTENEEDTLPEDKK